MTDLFDRYRVIDVDTHLTEPPDVWTARMPSALHEKVPHIERVDGRDVWMADGNYIGAPGFYSMAGFDGVLPARVPATYDEIAPAMYDSSARVAFARRRGHPGPGAVPERRWLRERLLHEARRSRARARRACRPTTTSSPTGVGVAPDRLIAITALPFWDVELAVAELHRCVANGHRAVNFCNQPQDYGQPPLAHPHWDPIWAAAQEAGVSVSFHVGGGSMGTQFDDVAEMGWMTNFAKVSSLIFLDNIRCVTDLIFGGVCHRFPDLKLVSVESGVGWIPSMLETCDWQWRNGGVLDEHPEYDLLPSEYFRRQVYGCFWFEEASARDAIGRFPDNILYETDYPHPTCQHPGPRTPAQRPRDYASRVLGDLADDVLAKVLHDNAAAVYGLA